MDVLLRKLLCEAAAAVRICSVTAAKASASVSTLHAHAQSSFKLEHPESPAFQA
jgi:hypothetical protein